MENALIVKQSNRINSKNNSVSKKKYINLFKI